MADNITATTLELAEVIRALRQELIIAQQSGQDEKIRFKVDQVEVELETLVEKEVGGKGSGKIKFWVVDVNAEINGKYKNATRHKIKLSLKPVDKNGQLYLSDVE
jgi:hypothetical protein